MHIRKHLVSQSVEKNAKFDNKKKWKNGTKKTKEERRQRHGGRLLIDRPQGLGHSPTGRKCASPAISDCSREGGLTLFEKMTSQIRTHKKKKKKLTLQPQPTQPHIGWITKYCIDHLDHSLPIRVIVQDLNSLHPTQETRPRSCRLYIDGSQLAAPWAT